MGGCFDFVHMVAVVEAAGRAWMQAHSMALLLILETDTFKLACFFNLPMNTVLAAGTCGEGGGCEATGQLPGPGEPRELVPQEAAAGSRHHARRHPHGRCRYAIPPLL